ncbi:MAG: hypothetical protein K1X71_16205 [Pirellulales bacterium]|nr:hypothetical protein [Pirellulales bacterium]
MTDAPHSPCSAKAGPIEIAFVRRADRYAHQIQVDGSAWLESIEGSEVERWPASPPLQELASHSLPAGGAALLLVGMAGRSHWSLSVAVAGEPDRLRFDAACRANEPPVWLGSTYRLRCGITATSESGRWLLVKANSESRLALEATGAEVVFAAGELTIRPTDHSTKLPATARWQYEWTMC